MAGASSSSLSGGGMAGASSSSSSGGSMAGASSSSSSGGGMAGASSSSGGGMAGASSSSPSGGSMAGASSSSSSGGSWKYDVFINFRGEDTRRCFVCHLHEALKQKALDTFIDSEGLRKGDDLSELLKAIQGSALSIVVFSKNYASSTWCLKELVQILKWMDTQKQIVVPIFYEVDPSDVRHRRGSFAEAFAKYESDSIVDKEELESWKSSLEGAAKLSGWDSKNYQ